MTAAVIVSNQEVECAGLKVFASDAGVSAQSLPWSSDLSSIVSKIISCKPSFVVLDLEGERRVHPERFRLAEQLRERGLKAPIVSWLSSVDFTVLAQVEAHDTVFLNRALSRAEYVDFFKTLLRGEVPQTNGWKGPTGVNGTSAADHLTKREREVLVCVASGLTNKQSAGQLGISYETVKEHVQHILRKLGVSDRTQAAVWAVRNRIV